MKNVLLSLLIIAGVYTTQAQIKVHDIKPDSTISTWDAFTIVPMLPDSNNLVVWLHPVPEVVVTCWGNFDLLYSGSFPAKLNSGADINASGTWKHASYEALFSGSDGNWKTDATDKYLAFRVKPAGTWYYGWLKMSVAAAAASFTVKEWGYNLTAGQAIKAGQTSTTGIDNIVITKALSIYPNPAKDNIYIQHMMEGDGTLQVINTAGQTIREMKTKTGDDNIHLNIQELSAGRYTLLLQDDKVRYSGTFIK